MRFKYQWRRRTGLSRTLPITRLVIHSRGHIATEIIHIPLVNKIGSVKLNRRMDWLGRLVDLD